jgi:HK97 family phage portal protein
MKKEIDKHALIDLWRRPNPSIRGSGSFVEKLFGFWHMAGNSYIWAFRPNPNEPPLALWPLRPDRMKAVASDAGVSSYVYGYGSRNPQIFEISDVMHLKFEGYDDDIYGLSPVEVAAYLADQQNEAMGWNTALMQNAGRPASVFTSKSYLTEEQREQVKAELRRKYSGKRNAGQPLILEADMTWQNMSLNPMELDWLKSRELNTRDIAAIFDVAPELAGDSAGKTFANVAEARQALYLENVLPKLDRVRDYANSWLVPMYQDLARNGAYWSYDIQDVEALAELIQKRETSKEDRALKIWSGGIATLNEAREKVGLEKLDGGDCIRVGAILVSIDSISEYADQSLTTPAGPPMPQAEPLNGLPGADPNQPALPAPRKKPTGQQQPQQGAAQKAYDPSNDVYQPDDLKARLAAYEKAGIKYLQWETTKSSCPICSQNKGLIVKLGDSFPSGHILPIAHPNCDCEVQPVDAPKYYADALRMLANKLTEANEGYKIHEENIGTPDSYTVDAVPINQVRADMQLRPVQVYEEKRENKGLGRISNYRAFMEMYE